MSEHTGPLPVEKIRTDYTLGTLTEDEAGMDPLALFHRWLSEAVAQKLPEPHAMTVATASTDGMPSARILLLRGYDETGFRFFSNYLSRKGEELFANPQASLLFFWPELQRQVRIEGQVTKQSAADSDAYWDSRPFASRISAVASAQSSVIPDRTDLERKVEELKQKYPDENVPRPETWGGYNLTPSHFEFWQGRASRLHDRLQFERDGDGWKRERLAP